MIGPKLSPPIVIQEKVLSLIKKWATTHKNDHDFKSIDSFYLDLITKGIEFPTEDHSETRIDSELSTDLSKVQINPAMPQVYIFSRHTLLFQAYNTFYRRIKFFYKYTLFFQAHNTYY